MVEHKTWEEMAGKPMKQILLVLCLLPLLPALSGTPLEQSLRRAIASVRGTVGIAVITDEGDTLPGPNLQHVCRLLLDCRTGLQRITAGIPGPDVQIAHKTGTSDRDASGRWTALNDVAHVRLPDGRGYSLAVLIKDSWEDMEENERIMAQVSVLVYEVLKGMD